MLIIAFVGFSAEGLQDVPASPANLGICTAGALQLSARLNRVASAARCDVNVDGGPLKERDLSSGARQVDGTSPSPLPPSPLVQQRASISISASMTPRTPLHSSMAPQAPGAPLHSSSRRYGSRVARRGLGQPQAVVFTIVGRGSTVPGDSSTVCRRNTHLLIVNYVGLPAVGLWKFLFPLLHELPGRCDRAAVPRQCTR